MKQKYPRITDLPCQNMAVVETRGDPNVVGPVVLPSLYGSVYTLRFQRKKVDADFTVQPLRARWTSDVVGELGPKQHLVGRWGVPVPEDATELPQKVPSVPVHLEHWDYGTVAEILHSGTYDAEPTTVARLKEYVQAMGYEIVGAHEEEYLTRPGARIQKTVIRYPVRKRVSSAAYISNSIGALS